MTMTPPRGGVIRSCNAMKDTFTPEEISAARELGISPRFFRLLSGRGLAKEQIPAFLKPSLQNLSSPYDIYGMKAAAERVRRAIERKEKILIFGDYDCDGICAISILMLALRGKADADYFIPSRQTDGYGISVPALEKIIARRRPDLVITVDCGITAAAEAEFLKQKGIDLVVTDHHEPQDNIPDCIVADAKIDRKGFYDLCGAGVALKLVQALFGDEYKKYLDIAALATIADVVPLVEDNRIIAYFGLKECCRAPRRGIKLLAGTESVALTSQDVMFRLAPRINAAGRLGSAMKAVGLFLDEDYFMLKTLAEELARDNARRQEICEQVVTEAKRALRGIDFDKTRVIVLCNPKWEGGVLGIAAARLAEEFKCPAILFSGEGEEIKGSARSVRKINVFELLSRHSEFYTTFGGHAQAAGVGMRAEDFERFARELNDDVMQNYAEDCFLPEEEADMRLSADEDFLALAKELTLLEPTGYGNPKSEFVLEERGLKFERIGFTPHVKYSSGALEIVGFSRFLQLIGTTKGVTALEFSLGEACFRNRVYAQGVLRSADARTVEIDDATARRMCFHQLGREGRGEVKTASPERVRELSEKTFGTAFLVFDCAELERLYNDFPATRKLPVYVGAQRRLNPQTAVIFAPSRGFDFSYYRTVVVAGRPLSAGYAPYIAENVAECVNLYGEAANPPCISDDKLRAAFREFDAISRKGERAASPAALETTVRSRAKLTAEEYELASLVLKDLGLIFVSDRGIITVSRNKTELSDSAYYRNTRHQ